MLLEDEEKAARPQHLALRTALLDRLAGPKTVHDRMLCGGTCVVRDCIHAAGWVCPTSHARPGGGIEFAGRTGRVGEVPLSAREQIGNGTVRRSDLIPEGEVPMGKSARKAAKKEAARAGRKLAGRVLANPRSTVKDKKLAAGVLSQTAQSKRPK